MEYKFPILIDLGKLSDEVGQVMKSVNDTLATCGILDRAFLVGEIGSLTVTAERHLSTGELNEVRKILQVEVSKCLPDYAINVGDISGQSGNVVLSVSKS